MILLFNLLYTFPFSRLIDFFIECNFGIILKSDYSATNKKIKYTIFEAISIFINLLALYVDIISVGIMGNLCFKNVVRLLPGVLSLTYLTAKNNGLVSEFLSLKKFVFVGDLSAHLFLIHLPVIKIVKLCGNYFPFLLNWFVIVPLGLGVSILISWVTAVS